MKQTIPEPIGVIDEDRLALLPMEHWQAHEFCFHLHDRMADLLVQYEESGAHLWVANGLREALVKAGHEGEVDLLQLLKQADMLRHYQHHLVSHLVLGLTSDMLHFLFEALSCFEKRKFTVGFALLRKPFKENLLFLAWLLADQEDFIGRFEANTHTTLNGIQPERRLDILALAIDRLQTKEAFDAALVHDMIFSKTHCRSFEPVWQRASHLVTSQGALLRTDDLDINFIFNDAAQDHLFDHLYANLPYLLMFAIQIVLECFARILRANELTVSHLILSTMGCFEALYVKGRSKPVSKMLSRHLRPFLKCVHCKAQLRLTKSNCMSMYLREVLTCSACEIQSPFPLYWLFAQAGVKITRANGTVPILEEEDDHKSSR